MAAKLSGAIILLLTMIAVPAQDVSLADLVPRQSWEKAGILKLTESERLALRDEIVAVVKRYDAAISDGVAVIAPSVSTSIKAREIRAQLKKKEISFRNAETVLVVVRSSLLNPLQFGYESVGELKRDADNQLNISGPKYHVYLYSMDDNLRVVQMSHTSLEAN